MDTCDGCGGTLYLDESTRLPNGKLVCEGCHEAHLAEREQPWRNAGATVVRVPECQHYVEGGVCVYCRQPIR
jgi:hypothetical protein